MNLVLTNLGQYAVKAALALARSHNGTYRKSREIVTETGLPARYAPQVLSVLREAGITETRAGRLGGHRLARPPAEISLLDLINAAEHTLVESRCMLSGELCTPGSHCFAHETWAAAQKALLKVVGETTLADLVDMREGRRGKFWAHTLS